MRGYLRDLWQVMTWQEEEDSLTLHLEREYFLLHARWLFLLLVPLLLVREGLRGWQAAGLLALAVVCFNSAGYLILAWWPEASLRYELGVRALEVVLTAMLLVLIHSRLGSTDYSGVYSIWVVAAAFKGGLRGAGLILGVILVVMVGGDLAILPYLTGGSVATVLLSAFGHGVVFAFLAAVVAFLAGLERRARARAGRDGLTGLLNYRTCHERMDQVLAQAGRAGFPVTVVYLDLDDFKGINDRYGHQAGDQVLQAVGEVLRNTVRAADLACRVGGEEFIVVLPGSTIDQARVVMRRFRDGLVGHPTVRNLGVTFSAGMAEYPRDGAVKDDVIAAADAALLSAKGQGKDRMLTAQRPAPNGG